MARFRVTDSHGYVVRGALVYALAVPSGLVQPAAETKTGTDGWASVSFQPTARLRLVKGGSLTVFVRARKAGESLFQGVSTRRLVSITLGPPQMPAGRPNPYPVSGHGVDVSWPNCNRPRPPTAAFAIIGVNDGHPFSINPCLGREHSWYATSTPSGFYLNTAYTSAYKGNVIPVCKQQTASLPLPPAQAQAYAIGCSEAADSLSRLNQLHLPQPNVFWLDVETSNRWSTDQQLNVQTLRGMIAELTTLAPQTQIGIYSFPPMWRQITGGWAIPLPEWIPRANGNDPCHNPFSTGPVWLAQGGTSTLDTDTTC